MAYPLGPQQHLHSARARQSRKLLLLLFVVPVYAFVIFVVPVARPYLTRSLALPPAEGRSWLTIRRRASAMTVSLVLPGKNGARRPGRGRSRQTQGAAWSASTSGV